MNKGEEESEITLDKKEFYKTKDPNMAVMGKGFFFDNEQADYEIYPSSMDEKKQPKQKQNKKT